VKDKKTNGSLIFIIVKGKKKTRIPFLKRDDDYPGFLNEESRKVITKKKRKRKQP